MAAPALKSKAPLQRLAVVVPLYNEEEVIPSLQERLEALLAALPCAADIIFVDDGSRDGTAQLLAAWAATDQRIHIVALARNFGHQVAVTAGLDHVPAAAEAVVIMDGDLQDPPEVIVEMIAQYERGYDIVYGQRTSREGETLFKRVTAFAFYRIMRGLVDADLPADSGDFRLMSRRSLHAFLALRERHRFLRGMSTWIGFPQTAVRFSRPQRVSGATKYPLRKMITLSWNAAVSFSALPLRLTFLAGLAVTVVGALYACYSVLRHIFFRDTVPGWTTLVILQCLIGGAILTGLGVVGEYVAKIFEEIKGRPLYVVLETQNCAAAAPPPAHLHAPPGADFIDPAAGRREHLERC